MPDFTDRLARAAITRIFRSARIADIEGHGPFRILRLAGDDLRKPTWTPGDKLQLRVATSGLTTRTYTPTTWDNAAGTTELLAFTHGDGPGARWVRAATPGDELLAFGPRGSLDLTKLTTAPVFVGDETSAALWQAWHNTRPDLPAAATVFEVATPASIDALVSLGIPTNGAAIRKPDDTHLPTLVEQVTAALTATPHAGLVLTGRSVAIAVIRRALKSNPAIAATTLAKTYWDPRRTGLD